MKKSVLMSLAISLSLIGGQVLPVAAQTDSQASFEEHPSQESELPTAAPTQPMTPDSEYVAPPQLRPASLKIPKTTGIVVNFLAPVTIDAGEAPYPLTLPLSQAITDFHGNVIVPENSPVSILLQPEDGGAKIVAQSIVINGHIVPIQATSPLIPGTTIVHRRANERATENGSTWGRMVASGMGFMGGGDPDQFDRGAMLGTFVGMVSARSDESTRVVQIPQGSVFVLSLEKAVVLNQY